jgi:hypothetical protein
MSKKNILILIFTLFVMLSLSSCAPEGYTEKEYGFFHGIWHGMIFIVALIGKLFGADIGLYAEHNIGFFYWLGFIIGIVFLGGGGGTASRRRRRTR